MGKEQQNQLNPLVFHHLKFIFMNKIAVLLVLLLTIQARAQKDPLQTKDSIAQNKWVDSIMGR